MTKPLHFLQVKIIEQSGAVICFGYTGDVLIPLTHVRKQVTFSIGYKQLICFVALYEGFNGSPIPRHRTTHLSHIQSQRLEVDG